MYTYSVCVLFKRAKFVYNLVCSLNLSLILTDRGIQRTQADHKFIHTFPSPRSTENYLNSESLNRGGVVAEI